MVELKVLKAMLGLSSQGLHHALSVPSGFSHLKWSSLYALLQKPLELLLIVLNMLT